MKKLFLTGALLLSAVGLPLSGAEKTFDLSFDDYTVVPQIAKGGKERTGFPNGDLQLRMYKGVKSNALNIGNSEQLSFKMKGNFNPKKGTVILWISPSNWSTAGTEFQLFFSAVQGKYRFEIAKTWANYITAAISNPVPYLGKPKSGAQVQSRLDVNEWRKGRYHQVAVTWTGETMHLYIDGKKPAITPIYAGQRRVPPTVPNRKMTPAVQYPEASDKGTVTIGCHFWRKNRKVNLEHSTAFDQVTIWDEPLTPAQIKAEYEKIVPPKSVANENILSIPRLKSKAPMTGDLSAPVWQNAVKVPLIPVKSAPDNNLYALAWHDGKELHFGFSTDAVCQQKSLTRHDDPIWKDDAFEILLRANDNNYYHFIINGNGAVYDMLNRNPAWNSKVRTAVKHGKKGWTAEMAVPLSDFNGATEFAGEICSSSRPGIYYHLYRWAGNGIHYTPIAKIVLNKRANALRIDSVGQPEFGKLNLTGTTTKKAQFKIIMDGEKTQVYNVDPGKFALSPKLLPGSQKIEISGSDSVWQREITVRHPLTLAFDYKMWNRELKVTADFSSAGDDILKELGKKGLPLEISLTDPQGKKVSAKAITAKTARNEIVFTLPGNLISGNYKLQGQAGAIVTSIPFRVPEMAPYKAKLGVDHEVPQPWTAVKKVSGTVFEVWNRRYEFADGPFPVQITHGKDKLMAKVPVWSFNGKLIKWEPYKITTVHPDYIAFTGEGKLDKAVIKWQGELWFDGAYILKMQLAPVGKRVDISDFGITYTMSADAGRYVMNPEFVPWVDNKVEMQLGPGRGRKDNVIWLSGFEKGICFWTESNANWVVDRKQAPLTAIRHNGGSDVKIKIIGKKVALTKTAAYTFVLTATPTRPFPAGYRGVNYGGFSRNPVNSHQSIGWGQFKDRVAKDDPIHFNTPYPAYPDGLRSSIEAYRKGSGAKLHYYTMPGVLSNTAPDYDYWSKTLMTIPEESYSVIKKGRLTATRFCTRVTDMPADYWTWHLDNLLKDFPLMGGLYFDCASTNFCANANHGCSGMDVFNQPYVTSDALGFRKYMMRVYKVLKRYKNRSMMIHSHLQFIPFYHAFTDFFAPGENTCGAVHKNPEYPYSEGVTLDEYQSDYNARKTGVAYCMLLQNARAANQVPALKPYVKKYMKEPEHAIRSIMPFLVHDVNIWDSYVHKATVIRYWRLRNAIKMGAVSKFTGYWENDCPVKTTSEKIYASVYEWQDKSAPYRRVIVVGNFNRTAGKTGLQVDWKSLGIEKPQSVRELWSDKDIPAAELENYQLQGNHFAMFGIK